MAQRWAQYATGYRIRDGNVVAFVAMPYQTGAIAAGTVRVVYDDGTEDDLTFDPSKSTTAGTVFLSTTKQAAKDGWVVGGSVFLTAGTGFSVRGYGQLLIVSDANISRTIEVLGVGFTGAFQGISVGQFQGDDFQATWVFQGSVAEDATGGTHVCTLTVTPGAGNELKLVYGQIKEGNTATQQNVVVFIDDGTNELTQVFFGGNDVSANVKHSFPRGDVAPPAAGTFGTASVMPDYIISGTMRLVLQVTTAAVSVTQTFAVVCRIKGAPPTATLADSVGTPVLTTNTSAVFG